METSFRILQELIVWLEKFEVETPKEEKDLKDFIIWISSKIFDDKTSNNSGHDNSMMIDMELTFLLIIQSKHYKSYSKKVLGNSEITSPDSFSFLYHLSMVKSYRKMELIKIHLIEPPSGIEILKRLIKKGLITEFDDPDDKRAMRIRITDKGRNELKKNMNGMQKVFKTMTAELSTNEKIHITSFLRNMNDYHIDNMKKFDVHM